MEGLLPVIIQLVSGALGGNIAGRSVKKLSLGTPWNSVIGILGGGIGGQLLEMLGVASTGGVDLGSIVADVAGGGVGGGVLVVVIGLIKKALAK